MAPRPLSSRHGTSSQAPIIAAPASAASAGARPRQKQTPSQIIAGFWSDFILRVPGLWILVTFIKSLATSLRQQPPHGTLHHPSNLPMARQQQTRPGGATPDSPAETLLLPSADPTPSALPPLQTFRPTSKPDLTAALHLLTDSIAQQRQQASRALIYHPLPLSIYFLVCGLIIYYAYGRFPTASQPRPPGTAEIARAVTFLISFTMFALVLLRGAGGVKGYLLEAERVAAMGLGGNFRGVPAEEDGERARWADGLLVERFGAEMVGVVWWRYVFSGEGAEQRAREGQLKRRGGKEVERPSGVEIRGWTTLLRYRRKGVGMHLLEECIAEARRETGDPELPVGFAVDHLNAKRLLPGMFQGGFERREREAKRMLARAPEAAPGSM